MCFATDPPYYDNIGYSDLSDFFYVWLRRSIGLKVWPELFATLLTPKEAELIASPYRHGGSKERARGFFETGLKQAFEQLKQPDQAKQQYMLVVSKYKDSPEAELAQDRLKTLKG